MGLHAARLSLCAATFLAVLAAGCGGGGGGSPAAPPPPGPSPVGWGVFPDAVRVIGKQNFDDGSASDGTAPGELNLPGGSPAVSSDGTLFVAQTQASRMKAFKQYMAADGPDAAFTFTVDSGVVASASIHAGKLVVVEDHLVAIYDSVPTAPPEAGPARVAGGTSGCSASQLNNPEAAYITPRGQLIVADSRNHRVLIWNSLGTDLQLGNADVVVGQKDKDTCAANDVDGNDTTDDASAATLNRPTSVWSDGVKLIVVDSLNHRVLVWEKLPTTDFEAADHVIGQVNPGDSLPNAGLPAVTASTLFLPKSVDVSETGQMAVADQQNHRVLVWNTIPAASNVPADQVLGQPDLHSGGRVAASIKTFNEPSGVRFDGRNMVVVDVSNYRVLVFRARD
ncbi:hypothetical protein [Ramlibacter henchirensis]|nr:hypothetical protein [Ramlibacter henchirensis]